MFKAIFLLEQKGAILHVCFKFNMELCSMVCAWKALHLDPGLTYKSHNNKKSVHTVHFFVFPPKIYLTAHLTHSSVKHVYFEWWLSQLERNKNGKWAR